MPDSDSCRWQAVHFEQEAARQFTCRWVTRHVAWDITVEYLTRRVHVFADLHLEGNVPDMVQTEGNQSTFNHTVDAESNHWVLVSRPLREGLNRSTDRRPDKGQNHTQEDSSQTRDERHKTFTGEEAQIFWQLDAVETVKHIGCDRTGNNTAEYAGVCEMLSGDFFRR